MMKKQKGFTLIELLVVIGIIGLLATLAVVAFGSAQVKARDTKRVADIRTIVATLATVYQDSPNAVLCDGAAVLSGTATAIQSLRVYAATCGTGADLLPTYVNIANVKDPRYAVACTSNPPTATCDYSLYTAGASLSSFTLGFVTEGAAVQGLGATTFHTANQSGVVN